MVITYVETYLGCDIYYVTPPDAYEAIYRSSCIVGDYFKISAVKKRICEGQGGIWDGTLCLLCRNPFPWATESPYEGETVTFVELYRGWGIWYLTGPGGLYGITDPDCVDQSVFFYTVQAARNKIDTLIPTSATVTVKGMATGGYPVPDMRLYVFDKDVQAGYKDFSPISFGAQYTFEKVVTGAGIHLIYGRMVLTNPMGSYEFTTPTEEFELG